MMRGAGVHVWLIDLNKCGSALREAEELKARLSPDEKARAVAHPDQPAAETWLATRTALRILIEAVTGRELGRQPFVISPAGKPSLPGHCGGVSFNLSHSGTYALVALSREPVGIDLESARRTVFPDRQRALLISAAEAMAGDDLETGHTYPGLDVDHALLQAWVRIEAVAKARGSGLGGLLNDIGIRGPAKVTSAAAVAGRADALMVRERLKLADLSLPAGLWGAVAGSAVSENVRLHDFPVDLERIFECCPSPHLLAAG